MNFSAPLPTLTYESDSIEIRNILGLWIKVVRKPFPSLMRHEDRRKASGIDEPFCCLGKAPRHSHRCTQYIHTSGWWEGRMFFWLIDSSVRWERGRGSTLAWILLISHAHGATQSPVVGNWQLWVCRDMGPCIYLFHIFVPYIYSITLHAILPGALLAPMCSEVGAARQGIKQTSFGGNSWGRMISWFTPQTAIEE